MEAEKAPPPVPFHRASLEIAASLGCRKCLKEYQTGVKADSQCHDANCPRKRQKRGSSYHQNYSNRIPPNRLIVNKPPAVAGSVIPSAPAAGSKRKRGGTTVTSAAAAAAAAASKSNNTLNENNENDDDIDILNGKSTRIGNSIDFPLGNVTSHLICSLCNGYFRDPHTVADCLHTFCRSCLILFFRQGMRCCPTCNTRLGPDPFHTSISIQSREVIPDRTLQEVVHKIFPWMKAQEEEEERNFYARRGIELKPEYAHEGTTSNSSLAKSSSGGGASGSSRGSSGGKTSHSMKMVEDLLDLKLEPDEHPSTNLHQRLPPLQNSLLRTSGKLKMVSLKKYIVQRLGLKDSKSSIEILCNGDPMGDELSLTFIVRTRWFSPNQVLTLKYRLEEEGDKE